MPIFHTPQVILFSDNLPRTVAFYSRLGFTETFRVAADGEPIHSRGPPTPTATQSRSSSPMTMSSPGTRIALFHD
jgi:hypothetical protein